MQTFKIKKIQNEFLMLTQFHGEQVKSKICAMEIDDEFKVKMVE